MIESIKAPVRNPNTIRLIENNQYTFDVDPKATKTDVKRWIEGFFGIKIIKINSHRPPSKIKRMGPKEGYSARYKRMIVTVQSGQSIPIF